MKPKTKKKPTSGNVFRINGAEVTPEQFTAELERQQQKSRVDEMWRVYQRQRQRRTWWQQVRDKWLSFQRSA